ncbi:MAG: S-adenosyl-l-methionine hydroxide adenosyltransferase family protein [Sulfolobus sp.]|nr:S-adenosyl-l-methionine hydroxide adenosyltransferase family protein [Sulfolobus sp.]
MYQNRRIISILTDFGVSDNYNGTMEGVIKTINKDAEIAYIAGNAKSFNILAGAYLLYTSYRYFPRGTIFLTVIDPGVGTSRNAIIVKTKHYYFIGPDNGVLYPAANEDEIQKIIKISNPKLYLSKKISNTFHGRDIFSVAAAFVSLNIDLDVFGPEIPIDKISKLDLFYIKSKENKKCFKVIYIDHFGNVTLSYKDPERYLANIKEVCITSKLKARKVRTFGDGKEGELLIYANGYNFLELGINKGNASDALNVKEGDEICLEDCTQEDFSHSI